MFRLASLAAVIAVPALLAAAPAKADRATLGPDRIDFQVTATDRSCAPVPQAVRVMDDGRLAFQFGNMTGRRIDFHATVSVIDAGGTPNNQFRREYGTYGSAFNRAPGADTLVLNGGVGNAQINYANLRARVQITGCGFSR